MVKYLILSLFCGIGCFSTYVAMGQIKPSQRIVVAYVVSGTTSLPDTKLLTHINYAFGHINDTFDGIRIENEERLHDIAALKKQKRNLKVLLSIGGWESGRFSEMAADEIKRNAFAQACRTVIERFNLDGVDIDWEYPTSKAAGISASPQDTENYTLMMQAIRKGIGKKKLLTLASVANAAYIDFKAILDVVDFVNIMAYDMIRPPYHHAPLYPSPNSRGGSCQEAIEAHIKQGIPACKLVLGVPFYGRGDDTIGNFIDYKKIIQQTQYTYTRDKQAGVPYLSDKNGVLVCSFDDAWSVAQKTRFVIQKGLLGVMYWQYDGDNEQGILRTTIYNELKGTK